MQLIKMISKYILMSKCSLFFEEEEEAEHVFAFYVCEPSVHLFVSETIMFIAVIA